MITLLWILLCTVGIYAAVTALLFIIGVSSNSKDGGLLAMLSPFWPIFALLLIYNLLTRLYESITHHK